jgi:cell surface hyaluronidase
MRMPDPPDEPGALRVVPAPAPARPEPGRRAQRRQARQRRAAELARRVALAALATVGLLAAVLVPARLLGHHGGAGRGAAAAATPPRAAGHAAAPPGPARALRWSDPRTWNGHLPAAGATVVIPTGRTILLDVSPPPLTGVDVNGTLAFAERTVELRAGYVMVHGTLAIGSARAPYRGHATITLTGGPASRNVMGMGPKVLGVMGGTLEIHGQPRTSWLRLGANAAAGTRRLALERPVDWAPGDRIVVASTDFDPKQAEQATVAGVAGTVVTLRAPLRYLHWGLLQHPGGGTLDERAEVGLLTRNVLVQGDPASERAGFGGQVMIEGHSRVHVENAELYRMGQRNILRRYPIHFHTAGDMAGSYLKGNAIHHSFNRGVTVHGSNNLLLQRNVAYDVIGHCYFLEDGAERGNLFDGNLGLLTRKPQGKGLLPSDTEYLGPATFWITNPANSFRGNVAAGSEGTGFWIALPEHPTGLSATGRVFPRRTPLGAFSGNTTHSNGVDGLHFDNGPKPDGTLEVVFYDPHANPANDRSAQVRSLIQGLTSYKNRGDGAWIRTQRTTVTGSTFADNDTGLTLVNGDNLLRDSLIVGDSANKGTPAPYETRGVDGRSLARPWEASFPVRGFEFYDGRNGVDGVRFEGFTPNAQRPASALSYLRFTAFPIDVGNYARNLSFGPGVNKVWLETRPAAAVGKGEDGYQTAVFFDVDGSVTGTPRSYVTVGNPFVATGAGCRGVAAWNAAVCRQAYDRVMVEAIGGTLAGVTLTRDDGAATVLRGIGDPGQANGAHATVVADRAYAVAFDGAAPRALRLTLTGYNQLDSLGGRARFVRLAIAYPYARPGNVSRYGQRLAAAASPGALDAAGDDAWLFQGGTLYVRLLLKGRDDGYEQVEVRP